MTQRQYITLATQAPQCGDEYADDYEVIDVSHEFPENGFSYDQMRAGECRAYVRVTEEKQPPYYYQE